MSSSCGRIEGSTSAGWLLYAANVEVTRELECAPMTIETMKPRAEIRYCVKCRWLLRAAWLAQELLVDVRRRARRSGAGARRNRRVRSDASAIGWCGNASATTGFPEAAELKRRVRDVLDPARDLGHLDRPATPVSTEIHGAMTDRRRRSGEKYTTELGFSAIKDGIKAHRDRSSDAEPRRGTQTAVAAREARRRPGFDAVRKHRARPSSVHGLRRVALPEHRRMLESRHRHIDADGRRVHARMPLLRGRHRQSGRLARFRRTGECGRVRPADEPPLRRVDVGRSRRPRETAAPRTTPRASARSKRAIRRPPSKR